jgi:hypothetical protein
MLQVPSTHDSQRVFGNSLALVQKARVTSDSLQSFSLTQGDTAAAFFVMSVIA